MRCMNQLCSACSSSMPSSLHARLDARRGLPLVLDRLVAADVDVRAGKQLHDFAQHVLEKAEASIVDIVTDTGRCPSRPAPPAAHPPVRRARGYATIAASAWPGISISGTIVMLRAAA